jgi:hypothetical protein
MKGCICRLQLLLALASSVILRSESGGTHDYILLSQIGGSLNLKDRFPTFISPQEQGAQLYLQGLGSLFVASYDSQDYDGYIRTRLQAYVLWLQSR